METYSRPPARTWLVPLAAVALLIVGLWPTLEVLGSRWLILDQSYSHGFLILAASIVLVVRKWLRGPPSIGLFSFWLLPLLLAAVVYLAGAVLLIEALQQLAILPLVVGTLLLVWGWRQTTAFLLPIGLLAFAIPVWDYLSWPLQLITVEVNQFFLSRLDIEFFVEGVVVYFPGVGAFEIAHGCSGLRYLLVGLTLTTLYGELNYKTVRSRCYLIVAGTLLALVANWVRVFVIIYIGYESNMSSSLINQHDYFGWWVFTATLVPLFFIALKLENREVSTGRVRATVVDDRSQAPGWLSILGVVFLPILLFSVAGWSASFPGQDTVSGQKDSPLASVVDDGSWLPLFQNSLQSWKPIIERPDRYRVDVYELTAKEKVFGEEQIKLLTGLYVYEFQRPGGELVNYNNRLYDSSMLFPEKTFEIDAGNGLTLPGIELKYRWTGDRIHVAYGYYVEGRWESDELKAKLAQIPGILNKRTDASLLVAGVSCEQCDGEKLLQHLLPDLRKQAETQLDARYESGR